MSANIKPKNEEPPQWVERLIAHLAAASIKEELLGDLYELFQSRCRKHGLFIARLLYFTDALLLMHPRLWREQASRPKTESIYSKSSPAIMFSNYTKIALRKVSRHKSYTLINVVSLSLGIACAIVIFTLIRYHFSFDTFHANGDRIYRISTELHKEKVIYSTGVPYPMGETFRNGYDVAEKTGRVGYLAKRLVSISPEKKFEENIAFADPEFLEIFNFPLIEGDQKTALRERNTAIITEKLAKKYFGDKEPVGQLLTLDQSMIFRVVGVLKDLPVNTDLRSEVLLPFSNLQEHSPWMVEKDWWLGFSRDMQCFVRLKPSISADYVNSKVLTAITAAHYDKENARMFKFKLQPLADIHFNPNLGGKTEKKNLWTFGLIGFFLIVAACVNFINLATAQAINRAREIGVRKALGSERSGLFWQFITETAIIASIGMLMALVFAVIASSYVNEWFEIQLTINPLKDFALVGFMLTLLVVVVLISGAYPGFILARFQPVAALRGRVSQGIVGGFSIRKGLVVAQFAISQLLIIGTLVVMNQLRYSQQSDIGFRKDAVVILPLADNAKAKLSTLSARFSEISGVEGLSFFDTPPASESLGSTPFHYDSRQEDEKYNISIKSVDDRYVSTFDIPLVAGRNMYASDTVKEYLLNETAVKALGVSSPQEVVGKLATIDGKKGTIVGVIRDFHFKSFHSAIDPLCLTTRAEVYNRVAVKVHPAQMTAVLSQLESIWEETYPASIYSYRFLDEEIGRLYKLDQMVLRLIQIFAGIAIFLGCLGLYGLVSFMAGQKTKEIGVRKVLGASTLKILWLFGKEFVRLLLLAFLVAAPIGWWLMSGWLSNFVYRVDLGWGIFAVAILFTFFVAVITVGYRSVKASLMDPVKTLKTE